jgi:hypothetical protein
VIVPPPSTQVDDAGETNDSTLESFCTYSDSSNFLLVTAVDILRQRNNKNGFIYEFIDERGYPVWDEGSAFYSKGHPVLLIPVVRPAEQRVTGLAYISVENSQPIYRWVPRGTDFKTPGLPDKEALETLLLGYEKKVFGTKQDPETSIQIKQEARTIKSDDVPTTNEMWVKVTYTICSGVDAGANGDTTWECDTYSEWIYLSSGGGSSGGTGGDDGGSGGGSGGFGGDDGSGDGDCANKVKVPVDGCDDNGDAPPAIAPEGVPQHVYDRLTKEEKKLCHENKARCMGVYHAKEFAEEWAAQHEVTGAHNGPQDALRHAMWSARMAYAYGEKYAKKWGDAHESESIYPDETRMDQYNNAVGRNIGGPAGRDLNHFSTVKQSILETRDNGGLCLSVMECGN